MKDRIKAGSIFSFLIFFSFLSSLVMAPAPVRGAQHVVSKKAVEKWADHFDISVLSDEERKRELEWFRTVSAEFRGRTIRSAAENIETHYWERDVLARAFYELTGIKVQHDIIPEGEIVRNITEQMMTGRMIYDVYVNDSDLIGTHVRLARVVDLTEYMNNGGRKYTGPFLDLNDFLNLEFGQDYNGHQLQLPDQQFPILYWFRYDWFTDPEARSDFQREYGYELGVPLNWAAYEDIARFFTGRRMKNPDGSVVTAYGHLDYGKPSPSLGWRFSDAWLSVAGMGDKGLPNGYPVDDWGIRTEGKIPVGSMVERGGALNSPAAVYALEKYIKWITEFAPPYAMNIRWSEFGPIPANGKIAQTIYFCGTFAAYPDYNAKGSPVCDERGDPVWRVAPQPHGKYWEKGMKIGYQDAGSWTIPWNVRGKRRAMAWLWAQFCVSKTVSVEKFLVGGTPVRHSTVSHPYVVANSRHWGGLVEFYRSPAEDKWTDSGLNVPHYPALSGLWWKAIAKALEGELEPGEAMDYLAREQDRVMSKLKLGRFAPELNPLRDREYWLSRPGSPKPEIEGEPEPRTMPYGELLQSWRDTAGK